MVTKAAVAAALENTHYEQMRLSLIKDDPTWRSDEALEESIRGSYRTNNKAIPPLSIAKIKQPDGSYLYKVIDGYHRLRALKKEGVTKWDVKVIECNEREFILQRAQACYNHRKIEDVFNARVEETLRDLFNRDMRAKVQSMSLYWVDQGEVKPRTLPPHASPTDLMIALHDHLVARPDPDLDLNKAANTWFEEVAEHFGQTPAWVRDQIVRVGALLGAGISGKQSTERIRLIAGIRDTGIRQQVLDRLNRERGLSDIRLQMALDWLGCGPNTDTPAFQYLPKRTRQWQTDRLAEPAYKTLAKMADEYVAALQHWGAQEAERRKPKEVPTPPPEPAAQPSSDAIFGLASEDFGASHAPQPEAKSHFVSPDVMAARIGQVCAMLEAYGQQSTEWAHPDIQREIKRLIAWAREFDR